jgi:hypothetical protein
MNGKAQNANVFPLYFPLPEKQERGEMNVLKEEIQTRNQNAAIK